MDKVTQWEQKIAEFEKLSRDTLSDIIRRAIITERAPSGVRQHLLVNAQSLSSYPLVRAAIENYVTVGRSWPATSGQAPMEIDPLCWGGKGGWRDKKGKDKDKGKGKGKG